MRLQGLWRRCMWKVVQIMLINLADGFFLDVDPMNVTLKEKTVNEKSGKEYTKIHGYFGKIEHAVGEFLRLRQCLKSPDTAMKMHEYLKLVDESNKAAVQGVMRVLEGSAKMEQLNELLWDCYMDNGGCFSDYKIRLEKIMKGE